MNGEVCCILGVCCPPNSEKQINALARELALDKVIPAELSAATARWILKHFDLAPAGSLTAFKDQIATLAREKQKPGL